jgi:hypothetical protein
LTGRWAASPRRLHVDNAAEFTSEALRRGCQQHGIALTRQTLCRRVSPTGELGPDGLKLLAGQASMIATAFA